MEIVSGEVEKSYSNWKKALDCMSVKVLSYPGHDIRSCSFGRCFIAYQNVNSGSNLDKLQNVFKKNTVQMNVTTTHTLTKIIASKEYSTQY